MIILITGLTGSGKTFLATKMIYEDWKRGAHVWANYPLFFSPENENITKYDSLPEIFRVRNGVIGIDEGQKLFDARRWAALPTDFSEKICQHRKHFLDIYTTTQDFRQIDVRVRINIHLWFQCERMFRFPFDERKKPIILWFRRIEMVRKITEDNKQTWRRGKVKHYFISKFFTKQLYDTYADIGLSRYIVKLCRKKGKNKMIIANRSLVNQGKVRL
jgi:type IV secretory pathway VirB4 component